MNSPKLIIPLLLLTICVGAQNFSSNERYFLTEMVFNPATAGTREDVFAILSTKKTWSGIPGSPRLSMLNLHMKGSDVFNNPRNFIGDKSSRFGFGCGIYSDVNGPLSSVSVQIPFAYHLQLSRSYILSFGIAPKFSQSSLNEAVFLPLDPGDPHLEMTKRTNTFYNFNVGFYLRSKRLRLGFSSTNLAPLSIENRNFYQFENIRTWYFSCRYRLVLRENFELEPYLLLRSYNHDRRADFLLTQNLGKHLTLGAGFATLKAYDFLFSFQAAGYSFGYLFELDQSPYQYYSRGNHMIFIGKNIW